MKQIATWKKKKCTKLEEIFNPNAPIVPLGTGIGSCFPYSREIQTEIKNAQSPLVQQIYLKDLGQYMLQEHLEKAGHGVCIVQMASDTFYLIDLTLGQKFEKTGIPSGLGLLWPAEGLEEKPVLKKIIQKGKG